MNEIDLELVKFNIEYWSIMAQPILNNLDGSDPLIWSTKSWLYLIELLEKGKPIN